MPLFGYGGKFESLTDGVTKKVKLCKEYTTGWIGGSVSMKEIKCNCTVCGSRFRVKVKKLEPVVYCIFCRAMIEDTEYLP